MNEGGQEHPNVSGGVAERERVYGVLLLAGVLVLAGIFLARWWGYYPHPILGPVFIGVLVGTMCDGLLIRVERKFEKPAIAMAVVLGSVLLVIGYWPTDEATSQPTIYALAFSASLLSSATGYALGRLEHTP